MILGKIGKKLARLNYFSSNTHQLVKPQERQKTLPIGQLAFLKGYMSEENVCEIIYMQKRNPKPFGELCITKGMMTSQQMFELLQLQHKNQHNFLNANIPCVMDHDDMSKKLTRFKDNQLSNGRSIGNTKLDDYCFLNTIFTQIRTFLLHQGFSTQTLSISTNIESEPSHLSFAVELKSGVDASYYICLSLNERIVSNIASALQASYTSQINTAEYQTIFSEILYCLTYKITRSLQKSGHNLKLGIAMAHIPEYRQCASIKLNTIVEPINISVVI